MDLDNFWYHIYLATDLFNYDKRLAVHFHYNYICINLFLFSAFWLIYLVTVEIALCWYHLDKLCFYHYLTCLLSH
jgi:hypothetical protein